MNAGTAGDVEEFQKAVQAISPSLSDVAFGVTYDIEEPHVDRLEPSFLMHGSRPGAPSSPSQIL